MVWLYYWQCTLSQFYCKNVVTMIVVGYRRVILLTSIYRFCALFLNNLGTNRVTQHVFICGLCSFPWILHIFSICGLIDSGNMNLFSHSCPLSFLAPCLSRTTYLKIPSFFLFCCCCLFYLHWTFTRACGIPYRAAQQ